MSAAAGAYGVHPTLRPVDGRAGDVCPTGYETDRVAAPLKATGRTRGMEELIDAEPQLARNWSADGFTPLHYAAFFGQEEAAKILLERGAEVEVVARNESIRVTPLHSAAAGSHAGIVKLLLEAGADPNASQDGGFTPLHSAAQNDDRESVEALLAAGADPARPADDGRTPAELAGESVRDLFG